MAAFWMIGSRRGSSSSSGPTASAMPRVPAANGFRPLLPDAFAVSILQGMKQRVVDQPPRLFLDITLQRLSARRAAGPVSVLESRKRPPQRDLLDATHIDRLNIGPLPTIQLNWLQPHEGSIVDFLFRARAFQFDKDTLVV